MAVSAGILLYRLSGGALQVLLVHPGGPLWSTRDRGAWSIPKGEPGPGEDLLEAATREFGEETGFALAGTPIALSPVRQRGGKMVHAWAVEGDCDPAAVRSNTFMMEWPARSGVEAEFPEVDRAAFFTVAEARDRINPGQVPLLDELERHLERR